MALLSFKYLFKVQTKKMVPLTDQSTYQLIDNFLSNFQKFDSQSVLPSHIPNLLLTCSVNKKTV